jgi:hypothetical protein
LYRSREQDFTSYSSEDGDLMCFFNIPGLMKKFGVEFKVNEWRLFIDSALLHNDNNYASLPIGHSVYPKESY